jgi:tetratricopeptide (TPR) repeat protein
MSRQTPSSHNTKAAPLANQLKTLFDELHLATRWQRPSILLAAYRSRLVLIEAQLSLENKLHRLKQKIEYLVVTPENFDIPLLLSRYPQRDKTIFFVSGLLSAGGTNGSNAYRALNMRRELLVDHCIRVVFWLTQAEADALPLHALDFWSFRHRMVELYEEPKPKRITKLVESLDKPIWDRQALESETPAGLKLREELLAELPEWETSPQIRARLMHTLAGLYWAQGKYDEAKKILDSGIEIVNKYKLTDLQPGFWTSTGLVWQELNKPGKAIDAYQKSLKVKPAAAKTWEYLAQAYRTDHQTDKALSAAEKSVELNPKSASAWASLGDLRSSTKQFEDATIAYEKSLAFKPTNVEIMVKLGKTYLIQHQPALALIPFKKARRLDSCNAVILLHLGMIYRDLGFINRAVRALYKVTRFEPLDAKPWKILGDIYRQGNRYIPARKAYNKALAINPGDQDLSASLRLCYTRQKA